MGTFLISQEIRNVPIRVRRTGTANYQPPVSIVPGAASRHAN